MHRWKHPPFGSDCHEYIYRFSCCHNANPDTHQVRNSTPREGDSRCTHGLGCIVSRRGYLSYHVCSTLVEAVLTWGQYSASLASIVRTILMVGELESYDVTWVGYLSWIWTTVECDLAIICISVPVLRTLAKRIFPNWSKTFRTVSSDRRRTGNSSASQPGDHPISLTSFIGDGESKMPSHWEREDRSMDGMELQSTTQEQYWWAAQKGQSFNDRVLVWWVTWLHDLNDFVFYK